MYIDTHSKEEMERSISNYLNITVDELYQFIDYASEKAQQEQRMFDEEVFFGELRTIISNLQPKIELDEILFFHLSRRLHGAEDALLGLNLEELLTTKNSFSNFIRKHHIEFKKGENNIITYYYGREVDWEKCLGGNSAYMKLRLGYYKNRQDYCINGFAFKDLIYKNQYAKNLYYCPEIISQLETCLGCNGLENDYKENSSYYCFEYKIPLDRVLFDSHEEFSYSQKKQLLLCCVLQRLHQYHFTESKYIYDEDNPILRLKDQDTLPSEFFIHKDLLTWEMLE